MILAAGSSALPVRARLQPAPRNAQASPCQAPRRSAALSSSLSLSYGTAAAGQGRRRAPPAAAEPGAGGSGSPAEDKAVQAEEEKLEASASALEEADGNATAAGARMLDPDSTKFMDAPVKNSAVRSALDDLDSLAKSEMEVLNKAFALLEGFGVKLTTNSLVMEDNRLSAEDLIPGPEDDPEDAAERGAAPPAKQ